MAQYTINNLPSPIDFQEGDTVMRTVQNAKNLLMCCMGEVPYDRYRGFDRGLYDLPIAEFENELLPELDRVMMWEPDVEVAEAHVSLLDDGSLYIEVVIDVADEDDEEDEEDEE